MLKTAMLNHITKSKTVLFSVFSGESAFHCISSHLGWAVHPMLPRLAQAQEDVPITMIYGGRSWIDYKTGPKLKQSRPNSYVNVEVSTKIF